MADIVRKNPVESVGDVIKTVKLQSAEAFGNDVDFFTDVVDALGSHQVRLLFVRDSVIGGMPKNKDTFAPNDFLCGIFGTNHKFKVITSNSLPCDWKDKFDRINPNKYYRGDRLNDELLAHEKDNDFDNVAELEATLNSCHLPKRVVAFSSKTLLSLFQKSSTESVDGTFKRSCKMYETTFYFHAQI